MTQSWQVMITSIPHRHEKLLRLLEDLDKHERLERDITQFNPMLRSLALLGEWEGGWEAERRWGNEVRQTGQCQHEVFIDEELYWYQEASQDTFKTDRKPLGKMPELPAYPWLRQIGPYA